VKISSPPAHLSAGALARMALLAWLGASGCTKFASELDTTADSPGMQTLELDTGDWSCVSNEAGNPIMNPNGPPLDFPVEIRDYFTGATPADLRVRACFRPDVACMRPRTDWLTPDETGMVTLPLNEGFSGYLEISGEDEVSTLYVLPAALTPELVQALQAVTVTLLSLDALLAFGAVSQLELDPGAGVVSMNTFDCVGPAAPGVRLELNAAAVPFSFVDGLPVAFRDTTTDDGAAGFANVLPGLVVVKGFRAGTMDLIGLETVLVRAGWVSVSNLMPQFAGTP
jgi:hypothetical protein